MGQYGSKNIGTTASSLALNSCEVCIIIIIIIIIIISSSSSSSSNSSSSSSCSTMGSGCIRGSTTEVIRASTPVRQVVPDALKHKDLFLTKKNPGSRNVTCNVGTISWENTWQKLLRKQ
jgi:hypothetical protein